MKTRFLIGLDMQSLLTLITYRAIINWSMSVESNSPFLSCCMPQFQSESWCTTIQMEMSCVFISLSIVEHQDSLRNRDKQQLGNGPLANCFGLHYFTLGLV